MHRKGNICYICSHPINDLSPAPTWRQKWCRSDDDAASSSRCDVIMTSCCLLGLILLLKSKPDRSTKIFGSELFCLKQQSDCWFSYDGPYMIPWDYFSQENTKFHRQSFGLSKALKTLNFMITVCEQIILITLIMHTELDKTNTEVSLCFWEYLHTFFMIDI